MLLRLGQLFNDRSIARTIERTLIVVGIGVAIAAIVLSFGDSLNTPNPN